MSSNDPARVFIKKADTVKRLIESLSTKMLVPVRVATGDIGSLEDSGAHRPTKVPTHKRERVYIGRKLLAVSDPGITLHLQEKI